MANNLNLSVTLSAINKATGPFRQIMRGAQGVGGAMRETRDHLRGLQDQQKKLTAFRDMSRKSHDARRALMDQREELRRITQQIESTEGPTRRLTQQQEKAQRAVDKLSGEYHQNRARVRELARALPAGAEGTRGFKQQQDALVTQIAETNRRLERQRDALRRLGDANVSGRFNTMTGEIGRLGRRTLFAGGAAAAGLFGIANSTANLGDNVAKSADKMGISTDALQELRYAAERSGVSTQKLDSSTERFVKRLGEARQGGGAAATAYEQLGLNASQLAELTPDAALGVVADRLAQVENHTDKVALAAQFFGREGVAMVNMLKDGSAGLDQLRADARATGYVLSDEAARDAEVFKDAMLDAELGMAGMKNTIGAELMPAITDLMRNLSLWMRENRDQVQAFARDFGEKLKSAVPTILELGRGVATFAGKLGELTNQTAAAVGGFDNLAFIAGTLFAGKALLSVISFGVGLAQAGSAIASFAMTIPKVAAAVRVLSLALAATPIGWIIAGIAAVAGAAYLIYKYWEPIKGFFLGLWQQVKDAFGEGIGGVTRLLVNWSPLGLLYRAFTSTLERLGISVPENFRSLGGFIIDGLLGGLTEKLTALRERMTNIASSVANWFKGVLGINSPSRVFEGFGVNIVEGMINGIGSMIGALRDQVMGMAGNIAGWVQDAMGSALDSLSNGANRAIQLGKDTAAGLGQGIRDGANRATESAANLANGVTDTVRGWLDIHSPSRVFATIGKFVSQGLANGIEADADGPLEQVHSLTDRLRSAAAGLMLSAGIASPALALEIQTPTLPPLPTLVSEVATPSVPKLETPTLDALHLQRPELPALPKLGALQIQPPTLPALLTLYSEVATPDVPKPETPTLDALHIRRPELPVLPELGALEIQPPTLPAMPTLYSEVATPNVPKPETPKLDALHIQRPELGALEIQRPELPTLYSEVAKPDMPALDALRIEWPELPQFDPLRIDTSDIQIDARPPLQSHASQPSGGLVIHGGINIEINAAPGMDEQALARLVNAEVQRALRDAERRAQANHRSAFHDID